MKSTEKIAMKISEDEYNDIFLVLKENGLVIDTIDEWSDYRCYLVNIRNHKYKGINLYRNVDGYTILPYKKELFLQYCGINIEETLQEYIKRVNSSLYSSFLAEKELKNRKSLYTTEDNVDVYENDIVHWVVNRESVKYLTSENFNKRHVELLNQIVAFKVFSTIESAEQYVAENTPQKTVDGFEIARGVEMWVVDAKFYKLQQSVGGDFKKDNGKHLLFKHKENAINHIVLNKETLSLSDLKNISFNGDEKLRLIKKIKEKFGFI